MEEELKKKLNLNKRCRDLSSKELKEVIYYCFDRLKLLIQSNDIIRVNVQEELEALGLALELTLDENQK